MDNPKVSVVTPAFNAAERITDVVHAVSRQRYSNLEHIVVNDGSTDNTAEVLAAHARQFCNLKVINQPNLGRGAARNAGLREAVGEYVLFLDDDDTIHNDALSELVDMAMKNSGSVVYCDWMLQYESGLTQRTNVNLLGHSVFEVSSLQCPFAIHGCLVPVGVMKEASGFDELLDYAEDWDLWQRLGRAGVQFVGLSKPLVTYNLSRRYLSSATGHSQFQQSCTVINRGFGTDKRVANPAREYVNGSTFGCAEEGMLYTLAWFAGIEYAQDDEFEWISYSAESIRRQSNFEANASRLASCFSDGIAYGRGQGGLNAGSCDFARLRELAIKFDLNDPSVLVPRLSIPNELPLAVSEVQHCIVGLQSSELQDPEDVGRVQPWIPKKSQDRRMPPGVYARDDIGTDLSFNYLRGLGLATLDSVLKWDAVLSLPRRMVAMISRRSLVRTTVRDLAGSSVDFAVKGSKLTKLELPEVVVSQSSGTSQWDEIFSAEDPWGYDKPYEVRKYEETLELLADVSTNDVVAEVACAEGHFTARLAPLVKKVRAYDISTIALKRLDARLKLAKIYNVETTQFDLLLDVLTETSDVVLCCEVLYYVPPKQLSDVVDRLISGLKPGGVFVHAHAFEAIERDSKPGFGWQQPFGAKRISEMFGKHAELQRTKVIETDLYLVERYEKVSDGVNVQHEFRPINRDKLEPEIANQVLWSGYKTTPDEASRLTTTELPVLTYHSIGVGAPHGLRPYQVSPGHFAEQLAWLRENGYRSPAVWEVSALVRRGRPIEGKAVLITFDDAYQCFCDTAWPLLVDHGFGAVMFAATSYLGDAARWDAKYGEPMKIMDRGALVELASSGLTIGSHSTEHKPMTHISTAEALDTMLQSKDVLQNLIQKEIDLFAYPYGIFDLPLARLAKYCGYRLAFTTSDLSVRPFDNPHALGRYTVDGCKPALELFSELPGHRRMSVIRRSMDRSKKSIKSSKLAPHVRKLLKR